MPRKKPSLERQLRRSLRQAHADDNPILGQELQELQHLILLPWPQAFPRLTRLLRAATSQVTKHYIAMTFEAAQDPRVLPPLMRAALAPENHLHRAIYLWPCAAYDCTAHLSFFVRILVRSPDPGEAVVACLDVLEEMKGPFDPVTLKRSVRQLLQRDHRGIPSDLQPLDEVITTQAAYTLLDKYVVQVDRAWKAASPDKVR